MEFNKKKTYRKFIYSPFTLFLLLIVFLVLLKALWGVYQKERTSSELLSKARTELASVDSRQKELAQSVDYLKTDQGVEAEMRSKFRVVRDGESVAVIVDADATTQAKSAAPAPSFWQRFLGFFGL